MGEITKLTKAASTTSSLRTTVPASIVRQFSLTDEDEVEWSLKVEQNELIIVVKPLKKEK